VSDCQPWLDATALWGRALVAALDGLDAPARGDAGAADEHFATVADLVGQASAIHTIEGETRPQGPVRVADGVLDTFLAEARTLS
jgi:hyaluronoglucosaminidase